MFYFLVNGNETMLQAFHNGAVKLYHDAVLKLGVKGDRDIQHMQD